MRFAIATIVEAVGFGNGASTVHLIWTAALQFEPKKKRPRVR
jgi:hypothetical protein